MSYENRTIVALKNARFNNDRISGLRQMLRFAEAHCAAARPFYHPWSAEKQSTRRSSEKHKNRVFPLNRYQSHLSANYSLKSRMRSALRVLRVLERVLKSFRLWTQCLSKQNNKNTSDYHCWKRKLFPIVLHSREKATPSKIEHPELWSSEKCSVKGHACKTQVFALLKLVFIVKYCFYDLLQCLILNFFWSQTVIHIHLITFWRSSLLLSPPFTLLLTLPRQ